MPVDIETEVVQLWAASRVVADSMKSKLPRQPDGLTIPQSGLRSGRDQQLAGLSQILELTRSFTLELAIKALFRRINPKSNPENTHDLQKLFNSLPKDVKNRLNAKWAGANGRSSIARELTLCAFLGEYRLLFEESRYLYERADRVSHFSSLDFDMAILIVMGELSEKTQTRLRCGISSISSRMNEYEPEGVINDN